MTMSTVLGSDKRTISENLEKTTRLCEDFTFSKLTIVIALTILGMIPILATFYSRSPNFFKMDMTSWMPKVDRTFSSESLRWRKQRDGLSQTLNQMKKDFGQQNCEMLKLKRVDDLVSENGGWCAEDSKPKSLNHVTDMSFSEALSKFLKGKTVVSFGDGPGEYKELLDSYGDVFSYTAFDGAPFCEEVTGGRVKFLDLTAPQYGLPIYDWGISVEVAEHIPAKYESIYIDNLVRHVREGLILSWAVPEQSGLSHVNPKAFGDVRTLMFNKGFILNVTAGLPLRNAAVYDWLKNNVHVYYRESLDTLIEDDA